MKITPALNWILGAVLCSTAAANNFSVSGTGGAIPDGVGTPWNTMPPAAVFTSTVAVPLPVTSITTVRLTGLAHTWRGDLQMFLTDPAGTRYNVVVRPGFTGTGFGDSGDYLSGTYDIVETGGGTLAQSTTNISGGTYNQYLNSGAGSWTSGSYVINNTPLNSITGPPGMWTLTIADWAAADVGSLTGWTLEGTNTDVFKVFCEPGADAIACPCVNPPSGPGRGCDNFGSATGGAGLEGSGTASLGGDTLTMTAMGENATALTIFFQGQTNITPGVFHGAGVRCVSGTLKRLYTGAASSGAITRPGGGDPTVSARSAATGDMINPGEMRFYFTIYRDPMAAGPCGNPAITINLSNAGAVNWGP